MKKRIAAAAASAASAAAAAAAAAADCCSNCLRGWDSLEHRSSVCLRDQISRRLGWKILKETRTRPRPRPTRPRIRFETEAVSGLSPCCWSTNVKVDTSRIVIKFLGDLDEKFWKKFGRGRGQRGLGLDSRQRPSPCCWSANVKVNASQIIKLRGVYFC